MSAAIKSRRERLNHNGQAITVSYEHWQGYCNIEPDGTVSGLIPDTMNQIAKLLNLTINYELFSPRYIYGSVFDNGTNVGAIGDVSSGKHETSVAGFAVSDQRSKAVDFTTAIDITAYGIIVKTTTANDISIGNYTNEYQVSAWISILFAFILWWVSLGMMLLSGKEEMPVSDVLCLTTAVTLRAAINKVKQMCLIAGVNEIIIYI